MGRDEEPRTTDQGQSTKRKYTVSDKVLAANRLNLEKARAIDKKIVYRCTSKRLEANRASLIKARRSPRYKPYVRNGLRAVDLRQSAPQVGETQEEYDRHMQLVERALPTNRSRLRSGVRGLAQALWRRRRLFGSRVHRETLGFYLELEKAAVWGLCPFAVHQLGFATTDVLGEGEHPRLEEMMECLDKRLVRVAEAYLAESTGDLARWGVWGKHHFSADFLDQPPEVIGNGLVRPGVVKRRLERAERRQKGETPDDMKGAGLFGWVLKVPQEKSGLLKEWVRLGYPLPDPRQGGHFALHLRLIEAAFFGDRQAGFGLAGSARVRPAGDAQHGPGQAGQTPALPALDARVARFKVACPELYQAVQNLADATWGRFQVFARQAEKEANDLREKLERAAAGTLGPGTQSLKELWREARDRRLAELPRDPIDEALWAGFQQALEQAKAEKQGTGDTEQGTGAPDGRFLTADCRCPSQDPTAGTRASTIGHPDHPVANPGSSGEAGAAEPSAIDHRPSAIPELHLQWRVERLIGVFLCSETYPAFKVAQQGNRRVEEAFRALERAVDDALPPVEETVDSRP